MSFDDPEVNAKKALTVIRINEIESCIRAQMLVYGGTQGLPNRAPCDDEMMIDIEFILVGKMNLFQHGIAA
jgi:hypothetical protein